jgi:hypothetical protein
MLLKRDKAFKLAIYRRLEVSEPKGECKDMCVSEAILVILREGKPMSIKELAVECQFRGCRPTDASRSAYQ